MLTVHLKMAKHTNFDEIQYCKVINVDPRKVKTGLIVPKST